jgi:hypothetical protein
LAAAIVFMWWLEHAVGFDRLTSWHRGLGTNTVLLLVAHMLLVVEGYSLSDHQGVTSTGWRVLSTYPSMLTATGARTETTTTQGRRHCGLVGRRCRRQPRRPRGRRGPFDGERDTLFTFSLPTSRRPR